MSSICCYCSSAAYSVILHAKHLCFLFQVYVYSTVNLNEHLSTLSTSLELGLFNIKYAKGLWSVISSNSMPSQYIMKCLQAHTITKASLPVPLPSSPLSLSLLDYIYAQYLLTHGVRMPPLYLSAPKQLQTPNPKANG